MPTEDLRGEVVDLIPRPSCGHQSLSAQRRYRVPKVSTPCNIAHHLIWTLRPSVIAVTTRHQQNGPPSSPGPATSSPSPEAAPSRGLRLRATFIMPCFCWPRRLSRLVHRAPARLGTAPISGCNWRYGTMPLLVSRLSVVQSSETPV